MIQKVRKTVFFIVAAFFLAGLFCVQGNMAEAKKEETGTFKLGDKVQGVLDESGILTISGEGAIYDGAISGSNIDKSCIDVVIVEDGITEIGVSAFTLAESLDEVRLADSVKTIGKEAFYYCSKLKKITMSGVQDIGTQAFYGCHALKEPEFGAGLRTIGKQAFVDNPLKQVVLPEGTTTVGEKAFYNNNITMVVIPKSMVKIGDRAFLRPTSNIKAVTIYSDDVIIGDYAFGSSATFTVNRNSTGEAYAKQKNCELTYIQYPTKLIFDGNGGQISTREKSAMTENVYGKLQKPKRKGYIFLGWFTERTGGTKITSSKIITSRKPITLYAGWEKATVEKIKKWLMANSPVAKRASLSWQGVDDAVGYQICYSMKSSMKGMRTVNTKKTSCVVKKLRKKKKYYFQVRAYIKDSTGEKIYGKWSKKKSIKIRG